MQNLDHLMQNLGWVVTQAVLKYGDTVTCTVSSQVSP